MRLVIDGDGSPVKEEVIQLGERFRLPVLIVTSIDHYTNKEEPDFVRFIYVDKGAERADYEIVKLIAANDILITQDYGLASLALPKGARVFHQSGEEYKKETIDMLLNQRYMSAQMRKAGKKTKGPKAFTQKDREHFFAVLNDILTKECND
ncbi:MAG: YaiI/YqxD family protein [Tetragenococcus sp.]|nr:YaiI/YqxD family protein [Tetragenococcus sp.]